jgi:hypothetical protein
MQATKETNSEFSRTDTVAHHCLFIRGSCGSRPHHSCYGKAVYIHYRHLGSVCVDGTYYILKYLLSTSSSNKSDAIVQRFSDRRTAVLLGVVPVYTMQGEKRPRREPGQPSWLGHCLCPCPCPSRFEFCW